MEEFHSLAQSSPRPPTLGCLLEMQTPGLHPDLLHQNLKAWGEEESGFLTSSSGDMDERQDCGAG